jgi:hypothetical protein
MKICLCWNVIACPLSAFVLKLDQLCQVHLNWPVVVEVLLLYVVYTLSTNCIQVPGREITAGQRTMSSQNAELSGKILTLLVILIGHFW